MYSKVNELYIIILSVKTLFVCVLFFWVEKEESEVEEQIEEISDKEEAVSMDEETETDESEPESSEQIEEPNYGNILKTIYQRVSL